MKRYKNDLGVTKDMWKEIYFDDDVIKEEDRKFLEEICFEYNGKASATEMTKPYGIHTSSFNSRVGALGKRVANYFNIKNIPCTAENKKEWWNVVFYGEKKENFIWELRPELREVIKGYENIYDTDKVKIPDGEYIEGRIKSVLLNQYERNTLARKVCLEHYGYTCVVCGEDLEKKYGSRLGKNFIHVHHEKPLGERKEEYKVNGIRDLKPVCPNCHSIIHRKRPCFKIEELKSELEKIIY
ncbi:MAG: HNH endonuclease [Clostridium sp.]